MQAKSEGLSDILYTKFDIPVGCVFIQFILFLVVIDSIEACQFLLKEYTVYLYTERLCSL